MNHIYPQYYQLCATDERTLPQKLVVKRMRLQQWIARKHALNSECALNREGLGDFMRFMTGEQACLTIVIGKYVMMSVIPGHLAANIVRAAHS